MGASTAREALIAEAICEVARLIRQVEALTPAMEKITQTLQRTDVQLHETLAGFEDRLEEVSECTQAEAVQQLEKQINESIRQLLVRICGALSAATQQVFQGQLGTTLHRQQVVLQELQTLLQALAKQREAWWVPWATHASAVVLATSLTSLLLLPPR